MYLCLLDGDAPQRHALPYMDCGMISLLGPGRGLAGHIRLADEALGLLSQPHLHLEFLSQAHFSMRPLCVCRTVPAFCSHSPRTPPGLCRRWHLRHSIHQPRDAKQLIRDTRKTPCDKLPPATPPRASRSLDACDSSSIISDPVLEPTYRARLTCSLFYAPLLPAASCEGAIPSTVNAPPGRHDLAPALPRLPSEPQRQHGRFRSARILPNHPRNAIATLGLSKQPQLRIQRV